MIKCENGELRFKGYGNEIAPEMGCIMQHFFENATEKETVVALETFKDGLSVKAKNQFLISSSNGNAVKSRRYVMYRLFCTNL